MKAQLILFASAILLCFVACRNTDTQTGASAIAQTIARTDNKVRQIALDSFQRIETITLTATQPVVPLPKNKLTIHRDKDSVTVSGVVFAAGENKTRTAYRFYFKASEQYCYAYLKHQYDNGHQQFKSMETGYYLHFNGKAS